MTSEPNSLLQIPRGVPKHYRGVPRRWRYRFPRGMARLAGYRSRSGSPPLIGGRGGSSAASELRYGGEKRYSASAAGRGVCCLSRPRRGWGMPRPIHARRRFALSLLNKPTHLNNDAHDNVNDRFPVFASFCFTLHSRFFNDRGGQCHRKGIATAAKK
jgi:hypothetical protein